MAKKRSSPRRAALPPLFKAKLTRPNVGAMVLDRPWLVQALVDHTDRPLTLITADAGYGKTTLLASFARAVPRPIVWYSLMPSDADPMVFGRYLLEGFRRGAPRFGRGFERVLEDTRPDPRSIEVLAGTLANELAALKGPPRLLVLDDFHEVAGNPLVLGLVQTLLRHLPDSVRLVLAGREIPPLDLDRMRARGEVFELDSSHLRLTLEDLRRLFRDIYDLPLADEELAMVDEATVGWPTAVHLVHESLRRGEKPRLEDVLARFRASTLELHDYLSSEVYSRLDPMSRLLLERTAPLSRFDADLAATLAGTPDVLPSLEALTRRGLLRTFGTGAGVWYECHALVRRLARSEVEAGSDQEAWRRLEVRAAEALEARGEHERALPHFLRAERWQDAGRLLRDQAGALLAHGRAAALLGFLADMPRERVREDLPLALAEADARRVLGEWDDAERLYESVLARAREAGSREHACLALWGLGRLLNLRGRHEQVLGLADSGLETAHDLPVEFRAHLLQMKAAAHFYLEQFRAAVRLLDQVRSLVTPRAEPALLVPIVHNLAMAYAAQGRFREAHDELRTALAQIRGTSSPRAPLYLSNLAWLLCELGELSDARQAAQDGLAAARHFSNRPQEATCNQGLARIHALSGDLDGALAALRRAEEINADLRMELIAADLLALRARIFCARGAFRRGVEFVNEAIARFASRPDDPRLIEFEAVRAWCELRAGRVHVARDALQRLVARADADENDFRRMRIHYWLGEALLALADKRRAEPHLAVAMKLARERGYLPFLKTQAREEPAPLLHALERGIEVGTIAAALADAGAAVEEPLLRLLPGAPTKVGEAVLTTLTEVGGRRTADELRTLSKAKPSLRPAVRAALRHVSERLARGSAAALDEARPVRLTLFGRPHVLVDGQPLPASAWRAQRALHVLIYLALRPRGAGKDELLERFWPGRQAAAGRRNFHPTLSYVRSVLPRAKAPPILLDGGFYRLNPQYPLGCDAWDFERALEEARSARAPAGRKEALGRALALASAPFLHGLYADWSDEEQLRLRDRIEKLALELGDLHAKDDQHEEALECYRRAAELDEFQEATRLLMIECLVRLGKRRAAIAEYDKLKALLRRELGIEPLPETEEAVKRLLGGDAGAAARETEVVSEGV